MSQTQHVLIFGATGEIGSRIAHGCVAAGHRVVGVTRGTNTRHRVDLQGVEMVTGDKGDKAFVQKMAAEHAFDTVVDSVPTPAHVDLAFKAFGNQLTHYLMCSSTGTFVPLQAMPADETHPWETKTPVNFWPQCERDSFALSLHEEHGFPVSILRPTNIIGAGRVPLDTWGGRSLAYWRRLKAGEPIEIPVTGQTLVQSGCNDDLGSAFVDAVACGPEIAGEIFIISTRRAITLDRYVATAKAFLGSASPVEYVTPEEIIRRYPEEATEKGLQFLMEHMCFDIGKAERMLGYDPQFTGEQGLQQALAWALEEGLF